MDNKLTVGNLLDQHGKLVEKGYSNKLVKTFERERIKASKSKIKETNFYFFGNQDYGFSIEISNNFFYKLAEIGFYDIKKNFRFSKSYYKFFASKDFFISESDSSGENYFKNKKILVSIKNFDNYKKIYVSAEKYDGKNDFVCDIKVLNENSQAIVVACPFEEKNQFCYFQKSFNHKNEGFLRIENQIYDVQILNTSFKWIRSVMPYMSNCFWASISGKIEKDLFTITLGEGISDTSSASENIIFINEKSYKVCNVIFKIKLDESENEMLLDEWKILSDDGIVNITFNPILLTHVKNNYIITSRKNLKLFGKFSGFIKLNDIGYQVNDFFGFIERNSLRG
ncbi:MAG: DUF2804 domain-containing protein [Bacilli bacterium]|nr:DUF2804 domain-containing protein [Bacilli bacterium]